MVEIKGATYTKRSSSPAYCRPNTRAPSSCPTRVIRTGSSYIRSPFFFHRPLYVNPSPRVVLYSPPAPVVISPPHEQVVVVQDEEAKRKASIIGALFIGTILLIVGTAIAVSISRDCKWIREDCTSPDPYGNQLCTPIYDCRW